MKNLALVIGMLFGIGMANAQVKKVLFLGNSYTYVNDLPQLVKDIALSFGDTVYTDQNTPGGYQLIQHVSNATTLAKIAADNWDFVVIQEQSQKPSFHPSQVATDVYPYAKILNDSIKSNNACTETVFYMTWGRENGDATNCAVYPPVCTYDGMQQRLRESYMEMADSNLATTAPVGVAWKNVRDSFPSIQLYAGDGSHPNIYGSYLAACVFYATLYQNTPIGSTYIPTGISAGDALILQTVASNTVLDSLSLWRINANHPVANFNYSGGGTINFTNTSVNDGAYSWDFGDGNTSNLEHPNNTYASDGTYPVQLIVYSNNNCFSDTITQNVVVVGTAVNQLTKDNLISIFPNPTNDFITIQSDLPVTSISVHDATGREVFSRQVQASKIDLTALERGIYFLQVFDRSTLLKTFKVIRK